MLEVDGDEVCMLVTVSKYICDTNMCFVKCKIVHCECETLSSLV